LLNFKLGLILEEKYEWLQCTFDVDVKEDIRSILSSPVMKLEAGKINLMQTTWESGLPSGADGLPKKIRHIIEDLTRIDPAIVKSTNSSSISSRSTIKFTIY
jgi:hypothetical protein